MQTTRSLRPLQIIFVGFLLIACFHLCNCKQSRGKFKGVFVFGTSVVDNGNNNYLKGSLAKVNYTPYGIDFPLGPTGRYSNGKTIADHLGDHLRLPLVPPFLDPKTKGSRLVHGVNYGSGGSGILDTTGSILGGVISMNQQIKYFWNVTVPELEALLGCNRKEILSRYLFMVATGNNDELGYFLNTNNVTLQAYTDKLISNLSNQLKLLYSVGARNFVLVSVYPLGCSPFIREYTKSKGCYEELNLAAKLFHTQLLYSIDLLKPKLPGSEFLVVNTYNIIRDIIDDPLPRGFSNASSACCELKSVDNFNVTCMEGGSVCKNRDSYVFFDGQHNTQAANAVIAAKAYASLDKSEVYPFNIKELARRI